MKWKLLQRCMGPAILLSIFNYPLSAHAESNVNPGDLNWKMDNWVIKNTKYRDFDTGLQEAWSVTKGSGVIVAVLDDGLDIDHEEFRNQLWVNEDEIPDDGIDNDNNGYIDDVNGWNFRDNNNIVDDKIGWSAGHGTLVSSVLAAEENGIGTVGIAPEAKIMVIKRGGGDSYRAAVDYAANNGASIVNMSFSSGFDRHLEEGMAQAKDVSFVAAAGNERSNIDNIPMYPAASDLPNVMTVTATREEGILDYYSNFGKKNVDVATPGNYHVAFSGGTYGYQGGTSLASPYVSGIAALIKSIHPDYTAEQLKETIESTVTTSPSFTEKIKTGGIVNARRAINPNIGVIRDVFPDPSLAEIVAKKLEKTVNEPINYIEAESIEGISNPFANQTIRSIEGIQYLTNLKQAYLYGDTETYKDTTFSVDFTKNKKLEVLWLNNFGFTEIDLSQNKELKDLSIYNANLTTIDLSSNTKLTKLGLTRAGEITTLSLRNQPLLENVEANYLRLDFIDTSACPELKHLNVECNGLNYPNLNTAQNKKLESLNISNNKFNRIFLNNNPLLDLNKVKVSFNPMNQGIYVRKEDHEKYRQFFSDHQIYSF